MDKVLSGVDRELAYGAKLPSAWSTVVSSASEQ